MRGLEVFKIAPGRVRLWAMLAITALALAVTAPTPVAAVEPPVSVGCEGDECQSPPPAPDDPLPGTATANGPQNPPVRFPKAHKQKRHPGVGKGKKRSGVRR